MAQELAVVEQQPSQGPAITRAMVSALGSQLKQKFDGFRSDRGPLELKLLRNLRQTLGILDPELEKLLGPTRSRAYPRLTRIKNISTLSRVMNLMFNGTDRNYGVSASPNAEMDPNDVVEAMRRLGEQYKREGVQPTIDDKFIQHATQMLADERAWELMVEIDDQLQELGGSQAESYVKLSRDVLLSGIMYCYGAAVGPFARPVERTVWQIDPTTGQPAPRKITVYKPQIESMSVWDIYPDMSAKSFQKQDGYFYRKVLSRAQVSDLRKRKDFFNEVITEYLSTHQDGNWVEQNFETQLRSMGVANMTSVSRRDRSKFEVIVWCGPVDGHQLRQAGVEIPDDQLADYLDAEVWMIDDWVIKADLNVYTQMGVSIRTLHTFVFEEDDTSLAGTGLPDIIRDSQMTVASSMRMLLDNASVVCGPITEVNIELLAGDQDVSALAAYDTVYRKGRDQDAAAPAVRSVEINAHIAELTQVVDLGMRFADMESFVNPATGGDMAKLPSEGMRTVPGASMLYSNAGLPFKDIVRNFDVFVESVIQSMVQFNKLFNPRIKAGDYNVIAKGAASLVAKEVQAIQMDQLKAGMTPEDWELVNREKFLRTQFSARNLDDMLLPPEVVEMRKQARSQEAAQQKDLMVKAATAEVRKTMAEALKNITQSQKNSASADNATVEAAMKLFEIMLNGDTGEGDGGGTAPETETPPQLRTIVGGMAGAGL